MGLVMGSGLSRPDRQGKTGLGAYGNSSYKNVTVDRDLKSRNSL